MWHDYKDFLQNIELYYKTIYVYKWFDKQSVLANVYYEIMSNFRPFTVQELSESDIFFK